MGILPALVSFAGSTCLAGSPAGSDPTRQQQNKSVAVGWGAAPPEGSAVPVGGADPVGGAGSSPGLRNPASPDGPNARQGELIFAPIPISSEAIGVGLAPVVAYVFFPSNSDRVSPPSTLAAAGLFTSTRTYGGGLAGMLNLKEDRYRLTFLIGAARARYQFFGIGSAAGSAGNPIWLSQHGHAVLLQGLRRLKWNIFAGPRFSHRQVKAAGESPASDLGSQAPPLPAFQDQLNWAITSAAFGFRVQRDTRDDLFYPRHGSRVDGRADFFGPYIGSSFTFQAYQFEANKYLSLGPRQVLALRGMGCGVTGSRIPFFELCQFGTLGDLRGYQTGRYRDRTMFATQAEWRVEVWKRLGGVVFGGVGDVAPAWSAYNFSELLPGGGLGLRYNLSKQRRIHLRLDGAYSKTGASWSMGVAEVF